MDALVVIAAANGGLDASPAVLGASGVFFSVLVAGTAIVYKDIKGQRDACQAKLDRVYDTLVPTLDRVVAAMQGGGDLILRLNAERAAEREQRIRSEQRHGP